MSAAGNQSIDLSHFRDVLMRRRQEILDNQKPLAASMVDTNTRQGDLADQANGNNEVHIHLKLKQTDAKILHRDRGSAPAPRSRAPTASAATAASRSRRRASKRFRGPASASPARRSRRREDPEQLALLQEFYRDRLALFHRHVEGAKRVGDYEFNNTYQYVIAREEIHLQWMRDAIVDLGGDAPTHDHRDSPFPNAGKGLARRARDLRG